MQSEQDAREIAEKLTKAQRAYVAHLAPGNFTDGDLAPFPKTQFGENAVMRALIRAGVFSISAEHTLVFTDLGRAVASHLQRKSPS